MAYEQPIPLTVKLFTFVVVMTTVVSTITLSVISAEKRRHHHHHHDFGSAAPCEVFLPTTKWAASCPLMDAGEPMPCDTDDDCHYKIPPACMSSPWATPDLLSCANATMTRLDPITNNTNYTTFKGQKYCGQRLSALPTLQEENSGVCDAGTFCAAVLLGADVNASSSQLLGALGRPLGYPSAGGAILPACLPAELVHLCDSEGPSILCLEDAAS